MRYPSQPTGLTVVQERVRVDFWTAVRDRQPHGQPTAAVRLHLARSTVQSARVALENWRPYPLIPTPRTTSKAVDPVWLDQIPEEFLEGYVEPEVPPEPDVPPPFPAAPTEEVAALRRQLREAHQLHAQYREDQGQIQAVLHDLVDYLQQLPPPQIVYHRPEAARVASPIALVMHATDWHMGAVQDPDEIESFNSFSPDILRGRIRGWARDVLDWTELHRTSYDVEACHVLVTGDLISGDIHDELRVTNAWPAPVQAVEAGRLLAELVSLMSPHFARVVVDLVTADNHGRLTKKVQHKQGGFNSFSYPMAIIAQTMLAGHTNVTFNIHPKEQSVVAVCGRRYLICHGHQVMGWAGFPYYGIQRKVGREATKRMHAELGRFDRIILGHWHAPLAAPDYWIGGSASGTDAYDHSAGRESPPIQCAWFVHPSHGEFDRTDWLLKEGDDG